MKAACAMPKKRTFEEGYVQGWLSVFGPQLAFPEIPPPPLQTSGTPYICGMMQGIEAAKLCMAALPSDTLTGAVDTAD